MILSIIFGMVIFLLLVALFFINTLLLKRKRVEHQFEGVVKCLGNRVELFNKMISFIEENLDNEDKYLNSIKKSSMVLKDIVNSNRDAIKEIKQSNKLLDKFNDLVNVYSKLSKDSNYLDIVEEIKVNNERLVYAFSSYDIEAKNYNEFSKTKINSIISWLFKFDDYEYYSK